MKLPDPVTWDYYGIAPEVRVDFAKACGWNGVEVRANLVFPSAVSFYSHDDIFLDEKKVKSELPLLGTIFGGDGSYGSGLPLYSLGKDAFIHVGTSSKGRVDFFTIWARDFGALEKAKKSVFKFKVDKDVSSGEIYLIIATSGGLSTKSFTLPKSYEVDLDKHYNDDIKPFDSSIQKHISEDGCGFYLLHGKPGTGKTSYIRHLIRALPDKEFIFISNDVGAVLGNPDIISLLMNHEDAVLVVEDAEQVLRPRDMGGNTSAVSNILNMSDGFLGDVIKCHIICTINSKLDMIDPALTRAGRNKGIYEFEALSAEKSKALGGKGEATLAEIFNEEVSAIERKQKIGFV